MSISSDQCRAGRSLLNWTQDELAMNAAVSRATIIDFESNTRQPIKNNLRSIADCMFAAGIEFIPEEDGKGVGVRFRDRKLEYTKSVRIDRLRGVAMMRMRFAGEDFLCLIDLDAVDDYYRSNFQTDDEFAKAIGDILHIVLTAAERHASTDIKDGKLIVTHDMLTIG